MNDIQKIEILKNKNNQLKYYLTEREIVNSIRCELEIELNNEETYKQILIDENNIYDDYILKIKDSRKNITVCTAIFYIFMIVTSLTLFINFLGPNFYFILGSLPVMTIIYIITTFKDIMFLKRNNIKFFKKQKYQNNKQIKISDKKINILNNELKEVIKREFNCKKMLEQYTKDIERMFSNNEIVTYEEKNKIMTKNIKSNIIKR